MAAQYDIFKKTPKNDFIWVETAEDISCARKRLMHLATKEPAEYRLWDANQQMFVEPMEDCA